MHFKIETPRTFIHFAKKQIVVAGWCIDAKTNKYPKQVFLRIGKRVISCSQCKSNQIDFSAEGNVGFSASFKTGNGIKKIEIFALSSDDTEKKLATRFVYFRKGVVSANKRNYEIWIELYDTLSKEKNEELKNDAISLKIKPKISVVMPVFNSPERFLKEAINSVISQVYENWELCIADDFSTQPHVEKILSKYAKNDSRIKVVFRKENGHISAASNSAIELATGDWIAFLDHDDILRPHALYSIAKEINEYPNAELIYSDEDKINEKGKRCDPYFKPDWNPELLLSQNYICHLAAYKRNRLNSIGGLRIGYEGCQDWDLLLRFTETLNSDQIRHISQILYHWRIHAKSTAKETKVKDYVKSAGYKMLNDYLSRNKISGEVFENGIYWQMKRNISTPQPLVSLIIPTKNSHDILSVCVDSILKKTDYKNFEIIIVDNQSDDKETISYLEKISENPKIQVISYDKPFNYSAINNYAVQFAKGSVIGLINNDIEVISPEWLSEMVSHAIRKEIGCVGALLLYPNNTIQHAGVILGVGGVAGHAFRFQPSNIPSFASRNLLTQNLSAVTAACLLLRKSVFLEVGGLEEENLQVAFNDIDLCLKVREVGYNNLYTPYAKLYHHESASRGLDDTPQKRQRFQSEATFMKEKWGEKLLNDPAYNPNLSLENEDFELAFPPRTFNIHH